MPTRQKIKVTTSKNKSRQSIGIRFEFDNKDPRAAAICRGFALFIKEALTAEEAERFMDLLEQEKIKLAAAR